MGLTPTLSGQQSAQRLGGGKGVKHTPFLTISKPSIDGGEDSNRSATGHKRQHKNYYQDVLGLKSPGNRTKSNFKFLSGDKNEAA